MNRTLLVAATMALAVIRIPAAATAQVSGRVQDPAGAGVVGAVIEFWSPTERVGITTTDFRGDFRAPSLQPSGSLGILVRRIGYRPVRRQIVTPESMLIVLEPMAVELAPVEVASVAQRCPQRDDPQARQLWNRVRAGYSQATDSLGTAVRFWEGYRRGETLDLGEVDTSGTPSAYRGSRGSVKVEWRRRVAEAGYAWPSSGDPSGVHDLWEYPRLGSEFAPHFIDSVFAARHTFQVIDESEHETVFAFCGRKRKQQEIEGTISVARDGTILQATWAFRTREPVEHAGGRAYFAPRGTGARGALLLPIASYFWRDGRVRGHYVAALRFREWVIGDTDAIPKDPPS